MYTAPLISISYPDLYSYNWTEPSVFSYSGYVMSVCVAPCLSVLMNFGNLEPKHLSTKYSKEIKLSKLIEFLQVSWKLVARWRQETHTGRKGPTSYQRNSDG